jgi:biopolymer transport protein ExbD
MAFSNLNGPQQEDSIAEINVTPFVDVVLVLLIIFMITAGVVEFGIEIDVPKTREVAATSKNLDFVNITADGTMFLNDNAVSLYDIVPLIKQKQGEEGSGVYIRADGRVPWEVLAQVLAECGTGKIQANMITKPLERNPRTR